MTVKVTLLRRCALLLFLLTALLLAFSARAPLFARPADDPGVRDPYIQDDEGSKICVCWTTSTKIRSTVWLRDVGSLAARSYGDAAPARRHRVTLGELRPGSRYEYRVTTEAGPGSWRRFHTAPAGPSRFRFAVFGDIGNNSPEAHAVARLLERESPDFAVAVGDLAYPSAQEQTLTERFFRPLARFAGDEQRKTAGPRPAAACKRLPVRATRLL
jgi:phosphodiesterase/alkaline phosphatase D-like protein